MQLIGAVEIGDSLQRGGREQRDELHRRRTDARSDVSIGRPTPTAGS